MGVEVDQRVVEMKFDNKNFEKNVSTSMKTLKEFKKNLKFEGAAKGIKEVNKEASKFSMQKMEEEPIKVSTQFNAMAAVATKAIYNIVDAATSAGVKLVKSLSVDNIAAGWQKLQDKTDSVQTIMNATGKSIEAVNEYLNKLMWFSDETSYGFNDMTRAIAQMTSSGGDIDKLIPMVIGVANATAYAGKNASEFSRVMYNLNQSYGAGYLTYMDWRSVELAGVASQQLKQTFIDTAVEMGKIKKDEVTIANFAQTLKNKWADTEVMERAFGYFGKVTELAYKMVKSGQALSATDAYEKLATEYKGVSMTAAKAAQEAKTFSEVIDYTKDAVGSGWMKTFELIIGNYKEAKKFFTDLAEEFYSVFVVGGEKRNALLSDGLNTGLQRLQEQGIPDMDLFKMYLIDAAKATGKLDDALQAAIDEDFDESLKLGWVNAEVLTQALLDSADAAIRYDAATLKAKGYTDDQISSMQSYVRALANGEISVQEYVKLLQRVSGRENLVTAFWNIWDALFAVNEETKQAVGIISIFREAIRTVFPPITAEQIYNFTEKLKNFTEGLKLTDEQAAGLQSILTGLIKPIRWVVDLAGKGFKWFGKLLGKVDRLGRSFLESFSNAKPLEVILTKIFGESKGLKIITSFQTAIEHLRDEFKRVRQHISDMWEGFTGSEKAQAVLEKIGNALSKVADWIADGIIVALDAISKLDLVNILDTVISAFGTFIDYLKIGWEYVKNLTSDMSWKTLSDWISNIRKIFSNLINTFKINLEGTGFGEFLKTIKEKSKDLPELLKKVKDALIDFGKGLTPGRVLIFAFSIALVTMIANISKFLESLTTLSTSISGFVKKITSKIANTSPIAALAAAITALTAALVILAKQDREGLLRGASVLIAVLGSLLIAVGLITLLSKSIMAKDSQIALVAISNTFIRLGVALATIAAAFYIIGKTDISGINDKLKAFAILIVEFLGTVFVLGKMHSLLGKGGKTLMVIATAMFVLAKVLKAIDALDAEQMVLTIQKLTPVLLALFALAGVARIAGKGGGASMVLMIASLSLMVKALEKLQEVEPGSLLRILPQFLVLFVYLKLLAKAASGLSLKGKGAFGTGAGFLLMLGGVFIIGEEMQRLGKMDWGSIGKGATGIIVIMSMMTLMIKATPKLDKEQKIAKLGGSFIAMAIAIGAIALCMKLMSKMEWEGIAKGGAAIGGLMLLMALVVHSSKNAQKAAGIILSMSLALAIMTGAIAVLGIGMKWTEIIAATAGLSAVILAIAGAVKIITSVTSRADGAKQAVKAVAAICASLVIIAVTVGGIGVIFSSAAGKEFFSNGIQILKQFETIGLVMAGAAALFILLGKIKIDSSSAIVNAASLGVAMLALSATVGIIGLIFSSAAGKEFFSNGVQILKQFETLGLVIAGALAIFAILGLIGGMTSTAIIGAAGLGVAMLALSATVGIIGLIFSSAAGKEFFSNGVQILKQFETLGLVLLEFTILFGVLGILGALATEAIIGAAGLSAVLILLSAAIGAIGLIFSGDNGIANFERGAKLLEDLGKALGNFVGNIIGGILGGAAKTAITEFGEGIVKIFELFGSIDPQSLNVFMDLIHALKEFATANILESLNDILGGAQSLTEFGKQFEAFVPHLIAASEMLAGVDLSNVQNAATAMASFGELLNAMPRSGGLAGLILGDKEDLKTFAEGIGPFGTGIKELCNALDGITINEEQIKAAKSAGMLMAELQDALPKTGGVVQWFTGEAGDMKEFATGIVWFAHGIVRFQQILTQEGFTFDEGLVKSAANAGEALAALNNHLPGVGGVLQAWLGSKDLSNWATELPWLAQGLVDFQNKLNTGGFTAGDESTKAAVGVAETLAGLNSKLPPRGGKLEKWFGAKDTLSDFGGNLEALGLGLHSYYAWTMGIDETRISAGTALANELVSVASALSEVETKGFLGIGTKDTLDKFGARISQLGESIKTFGITVSDVNWDSVTYAITNINKLVTLAGLMKSVTSDGVYAFTQGLIDLAQNGLTAFAGMFESEDAQSLMNNAATSILSLLCNGIEAHIMTRMESAGETVADAFGIVLKAAARNTYDTLAGEYIDILVDAIQSANLLSRLTKTGAWIVTGIQKGMDHAWDEVRNSMIAMAHSITATFQYELKIQSPSKVMRDEVGRYIVEGLADGITDNMSAEEAAAKKAENIVNAFKTEFDRIETEIKTNQVNFELMEVSTIHESSADRVHRQVDKLKKEMDLGEKKLRIAAAKFQTVKLTFDEGSDQYIEAANEYNQAQIEFIKTQKSYYDALASTVAEPKIEYNDAGAMIIRGIAYGITSDMTAEEVAAKKAENIVAAFQKVFDSVDLRASTLDFRDSIWQAANANASDDDQMVHDILKNREEIALAAERAAAAQDQLNASIQKFGKDSKAAMDAEQAYRDTYLTLVNLASEQVGFQQYVPSYTRAMDRIKNMSEEQIADYLTVPENNPVMQIIQEALDKAPHASEIILDDVDLFAPLRDNEVLADINESMNGIVQIIEEAKPQLYSAGVTSGEAIGEGLGEGTVNGFKGFISGILNGDLAQSLGLSNLVGNIVGQVNSGGIGDIFSNLGEYVPEGFGDGVRNAAGKAIDAVQDLSGQVADAIADPLEINSPSKVTEQFGEYFSEGFGLGIVNLIPFVISCVHKLTDAALTEAQESAETIVTKIDQVLQSDLDVAPTISPVLDLSGVYENASKLGSDFLDLSGSYTMAAKAFADGEDARIAKQKAMTDALVESIGNRIEGLNMSLDDLRDIVEAHAQNDLYVDVNVDGFTLARATLKDYMLASRANGTPFYSPKTTF